MGHLKLSFQQALSLWWSFTWRAWLFMLALTPVMFVLMYALMPFPKPGEPPPQLTPDQVPGMAGKMAVIWVVAMAGVVVLQTLAMRWMIKSRRADLAAITTGKTDSATGP